MNEVSYAVVGVVAGLCVLPVVVVCWALVRVNLRTSEQNRDMLKALLTLSEKPMAANVAVAMEATDQARSIDMEHGARARAARSQPPLAGSR